MGLLFQCVIFFVIIQNLSAVCPNWCNKRGICTSPNEGGYCHCFPGFTGEDCSFRYCPHSFEPLNSNLTIGNRRTIMLQTGSVGGIMMGKIEFTFAESSVLLNADANTLTDEECRKSLLGLKSITDVSCHRESFNDQTGVGSYSISLLSFPLNPHFNNLVYHNGNPSLDLFSCNISKVDSEEAFGPYCTLSDLEPLDNLPLYSECSSHGTCDQVYGTCKCEKGFKGRRFITYNLTLYVNTIIYTSIYISVLQ